MLHRSKIRIILAVILSVSGIIGLLGYYKSGHIPILGIESSNNIQEQCSIYCTGLCDLSTTVPSRNKVNPLTLRDVNGTEYLDYFTKTMYHECEPKKKAVLWYKKQESEIKQKCQKTISFLNRTNPIVALISFPGSGNSWVRHLLEEATGVYTGSLYCDKTLKAYYPGEHVVSGNVVVVKTHRVDSFDLPTKVQQNTGKTSFDKAILIVRNPYDALVSEANRRWSDVEKTERHKGLAKESDFIGNMEWEWFVEYKGFSWYIMLNTWLKESHLPVLVIQYEQIVANVTHEITKMTNFLGMSVNNKVLHCLSANNQGHFKRTQHLNFDPFNQELKQITNRVIEKGNAILKDYNIHYELR